MPAQVISKMLRSLMPTEQAGPACQGHPGERRGPEHGGGPGPLSGGVHRGPALRRFNDVEIHQSKL